MDQNSCIRVKISSNLSRAEQKKWVKFLAGADTTPAYCASSLSSWDLFSAWAHASFAADIPRYLWIKQGNGDRFAQAILTFSHFSRFIKTNIDIHGLAVREIDPVIVENIIGELITLGRSLRAFSIRFVRVSANEEISELIKKILVRRDFSPEKAGGGWKQTSVINLRNNEEEILASFNQSTRYKVRRAIREGVTVQTGNDLKNIQLFYDLFQDMWKRKGQKKRYPIEYFRKLSGTLTFHNALSSDGIPLASVIIIDDGKTARYNWGATAAEPGFASPLIHYDAMLKAKRQGLQYYDMGGYPIDPQDDSLEGIKLFKRGFRGQIVKQLDSWRKILNPVKFKGYALALQAARIFK